MEAGGESGGTVTGPGVVLKSHGGRERERDRQKERERERGEQRQMEG